MKRRVLGILGLVLVAVFVGFAGVWLVGRNKEAGEGKAVKVMATNFPAYDFARAVVGEENVRMLTAAGTEAHHYEPTAQDVAEILEAELLVYNGGESESWVTEILGTIDGVRTLSMMGEVEGIFEEDGGHIDEHVWTSPRKAMKIVSAVAREMAEAEPERAEEYFARAAEYNAELSRVDQAIREVVAGAKRRELIFGDRFPFVYFAQEYGLEYLAAFPGCAEETEANPATITELIREVKETGAPVVLKIELTDGAMAELIASETGARVLTLHSAHNVSREDFLAGKTYLEIMWENVEVLREALK